MRKITIYYDCDGVTLNTIEAGKIMAKERHIDASNPYAFNYFFRTVDWNELIFRGGILDNSVRKIKRISDMDFFISKILTKLSGNEYEEMVKRRLFAKLLPDVPVITLGLHENKDEVVDPRDNILIEDSKSNADRWTMTNERLGAYGVGILLDFHHPDYHNNVIDDIDYFMETDGVKRLLKYHKF